MALLREAADAEQRAEHGGQHDADDRHAQRVQHADRGRPSSTGRSTSYGIIVSPMSKPAGPTRKSKPLWMPRTRMFSSVLCARNQITKRDQPERDDLVERPRTARLRSDHSRRFGGGCCGFIVMGLRGKGRAAPGPKGRRRSIAFTRSAATEPVLANRRGVHDAALVPEVVHAARQAQRRLRADVALEDLAVVADRLDGAVRPSPCPGRAACRCLRRCRGCARPPGRCCSSSRRRWPA